MAGQLCQHPGCSRPTLARCSGCGQGYCDLHVEAKGGRWSCFSCTDLEGKRISQWKQVKSIGCAVTVAGCCAFLVPIYVAYSVHGGALDNAAGAISKIVLAITIVAGITFLVASIKDPHKPRDS